MKTIRLRVRQNAEELVAMCQKFGEDYLNNECPLGRLECPFPLDNKRRLCTQTTAAEWEQVLEDEPQSVEGDGQKEIQEGHSIQEKVTFCDFRGAVLDEAKHVINGERQDQYGNPEDNFRLIAEMWSIYLKRGITPKDVALMMHLLKVARIVSGTDKRDSYIDACGYLALAADMAEKE